MSYSSSKIHLDLIPLSVAVMAFHGTSFSPENRADMSRKEFCYHMNSDFLRMQAWGAGEIEVIFDDHLNYCVKLYIAWLSSRARCVSTMIAGPSNFNVRKAEKSNRAEQVKLLAFSKGRDKSLKRAKKSALPMGDGAVVYSSDPCAIEKLTAKLKALAENQMLMKKVNVVIRAGSDIEKKLVALGFSGESLPLMGFKTFELTNNNAKIKQVQQRLADLCKSKNRTDLGKILFSSGYLILNKEADRIQIFFNEKPDSIVRESLKKSALRWSPKNGCWQRQITNNALCCVEGLLKVSLEEAYI